MREVMPPAPAHASAGMFPGDARDVAGRNPDLVEERGQVVGADGPTRSAAWDEPTGRRVKGGVDRRTGPQ
ncbi:hypothetical protein [Streptomyces sp. NBC_00872]|uniref:hypothetical protein n=1 Tax=Streptomyces sp. NBC_00872 TaxID=2903686 RepID=UPI003865CB3C|nr:hypothetical protein OG214_00290 [Streptomyces sp. NBC_00872]